jgi:hypothetical protein
MAICTPELPELISMIKPFNKFDRAQLATDVDSNIGRF